MIAEVSVIPPDPGGIGHFLCTAFWGHLSCPLLKPADPGSTKNQAAHLDKVQCLGNHTSGFVWAIVLVYSCCCSAMLNSTHFRFRESRSVDCE